MIRISDQEIIVCLRNMLFFNVTPDELQRPTKEFVIRLYSQFLIEFGFENINQPDLIASGGIWNIEGMEQCIFAVNIYKMIEKLLPKLAENMEINVMDILTPKRNRTLQIITGLISLLIVVVKYKEIWMEIKEKFANISQKKSLVDKKVIELKHLVEDKSMIMSSLKNKSVEQNNQIAAYDEAINKKSKQTIELEEEMRNIKLYLNQLKEKNCEIDVKISKTKEEKCKWNELLIESPEKEIDNLNNFEKEYNDLQSEKLTLKDKLMAISNKSNHYRKKLEMGSIMFGEKKHLIDLFVEMIKVNKDLNEDLKKVTCTEEKIKETQILIRSFESSKRSAVQQMSKDNKQFARECEALEKLDKGLEETIVQRKQNLKDYEKKTTFLKTKYEKLGNENIHYDQYKKELFQKLQPAYLQYLKHMVQITRIN